MFSVPRNYSDGFVQWIKQVSGLCLTAFLQSTILMSAVYTSQSAMNTTRSIAQAAAPK